MAKPVRAPFLKFDDQDGREIPLDAGNVWKIGRTDQNAIVLRDDMVSRNHALIQELEDGEFYLIDMGSRNGSFVNGRRLTAPVALRDGDHLSFGEARLRFHNPGQVAAAEPASRTGREAPARGETVAHFQLVHITVLVVDIRGYTELAQKINAGLLSRLVSTWFAEVDRILQDHGGLAPKHIGDAVMAVWTHGAHGSEHTDILRILRAIGEIARVTGGLHEPLGLAEPLRIGAGVNTGAATLGNTGAGSASDFTAIGDSVNVAFRLESTTKELGTDLVLGDSTFDYLRRWPSALVYFRSAEANLKGYAEPVKSWHISFAGLGEFLLGQTGEGPA